jgi:hypothetical protein
VAGHAKQPDAIEIRQYRAYQGLDAAAPHFYPAEIVETDARDPISRMAVPEMRELVVAPSTSAARQLAEPQRLRSSMTLRNAIISPSPRIEPTN